MLFSVTQANAHCLSNHVRKHHTQGSSLSVPVNFFHGGGHVDHLRGHPDGMPAVALWEWERGVNWRTHMFTC